ncbi:hypothetical protein Pan216_24420 [Planctomycetes bacterium Pan216]|uniref:Alginate export domain-containing protein n=1 Tax=Kolteria novifilia TaxID=2527975 RepID=A0A518B3L3_9BACT|nr:hypothetical protein Pan216_24420 [Planctomycetes bacterium Pan216]
MRRMMSICRPGPWLLLLAMAGAARGQEEFDGGPIPERTDVYSTYTDRFYNPECWAPEHVAPTQEMREAKWRLKNRWKPYFSAGVKYYFRSKPTNKELVTTTQNLFDVIPQKGNTDIFIDNPQAVTATPGALLFPLTFDPYNGGQGRSGSANDPAYRVDVPNDEVLIPGEVRMETDDFNFGQRFGYEPRFGIEFSGGNKIEAGYFWFQDWNATQLVDDVSGAGFLTQQVSESPTNNFEYFRFGYLSAPFILNVDAFNGLLNGESRREYFNADTPQDIDDGGPGIPVGDRSIVPGPVGVQRNANGQATILVEHPLGFFLPAPAWEEAGPHYPLNEIPALGAFFDTDSRVFAVVAEGNEEGLKSRDIPREATTDDPTLLDNTDLTEDDRPISLLWQDGELAIANYSFNVQGGDITYKQRVFEDFVASDWRVYVTGSVRYIALDEMFSFFFADVAGQDTPLGASVRSPFNRAGQTRLNDELGFFNSNEYFYDAAVNTGPAFVRPQDSAETYATYRTAIDNDLVGPQIGAEAHLPLWRYFEFDVSGRGGFVANFLENHIQLYRGVPGDARSYLNLIDYRKEVAATSGIIEGDVGFSFIPHRCVKFKAAWEFLWLIGVGTATEQIVFQLDQRPRPKHHDSVFFNGFAGSMEVTF